MARRVGQIIARGDRRRLIRVYLGRDHETNKRNCGVLLQGLCAECVEFHGTVFRQVQYELQFSSGRAEPSGLVIHCSIAIGY